MKLEYVIIVLIFVILLLAIIKLNKKDIKINMNKLVELLGGKDNIIDVKSNLSRFVVSLRNIELVDKDAIIALGAKGIVEVDNQLKIILGPNSKQLKKYIDEIR